MHEISVTKGLITEAGEVLRDGILLWVLAGRRSPCGVEVRTDRGGDGREARVVYVIVQDDVATPRALGPDDAIGEALAEANPPFLFQQFLFFSDGG